MYLSVTVSPNQLSRLVVTELHNVYLEKWVDRQWRNSQDLTRKDGVSLTCIKFIGNARLVLGYQDGCIVSCKSHARGWGKAVDLAHTGDPVHDLAFSSKKDYMASCSERRFHAWRIVREGSTSRTESVRSQDLPVPIQSVAPLSHDDFRVTCVDGFIYDWDPGQGQLVPVGPAELLGQPLLASSLFDDGALGGGLALPPQISVGNSGLFSEAFDAYDDVVIDALIANL